MRVLMVSKACIVGIYQRKLTTIAQRGVDLMVLVPPSWKDERGEQKLERVYTEGYDLKAIPIRFNGNFHLHHYPTIGQHIRDFKPDIVHIDEEPYNVATWQALYHAKRANAKSLFFSWQNINRQYIPPFNWGEQWVFNNVDYAMVGTFSAEQVMQEKGYTGNIAIIPQFGTDKELFKPALSRPDRPFTIGFIGRIVPEKGIDILLHAVGNLTGDWRLRFVGGGSSVDAMKALAQKLNIADKVDFVGQLPSTELPAEYHKIDVLILPSLTRPNWKEQFGRVLVEAMASGVPIIGSDSGAIPDVIDKAGLAVPEANVDELRSAIQSLIDHPALRQDLAQRGRERFLNEFTHESIADATVNVYQTMLDS